MNNTENHLIERLPKGVQNRFLARCELINLVPSTELSKRGTTLTHAYFPNTGCIALVIDIDIDIDSHASLEVGVVGRESMLGSELLLGVFKTPWRAVVQGAGTCWRIETRALRQAMTDIQALPALLQRHLMVRVHQQQALAAALVRIAH
ncbi:MAG: hypothetical protein C0453_06610 [Comamonadaceae bacterium]|nr:hypothetical protein [Comamonadaceae bacterium]